MVRENGLPGSLGRSIDRLDDTYLVNLHQWSLDGKQSSSHARYKRVS